LQTRAIMGNAMTDYVKTARPILVFFILCAVFSLSQSPASQAEGGQIFAAETRGVGNLQNLQGCPITLLANRDYYHALRRAIDGAKEEIVMSFFLYKTTGHSGSYPDMILEKLIAARRRGVRVEVILEAGRRDRQEDTDRQNQETAQRLTSSGIKVIMDSPDRTTHTKLVVIDRRYTFLGSHNLTAAALKYNNELSVLIESTAVAAEALLYINSLHP
jgi:phosphatidylserine/phosphatidylglycerophosphate/cardiolipin synthase-like enzyme